MNNKWKIQKLIILTVFMAVISYQSVKAGEWVYYDSANIQSSYSYGTSYNDPNINDPQWEWNYYVREYVEYDLPSLGAPEGPYGFPEAYICSESSSYLYANTEDYSGLSAGIGAETETYNSATMWWDWEGPGESQGGNAYYYIDFEGGPGPYYGYETQWGYAHSDGETPANIEMQISTQTVGQDSDNHYIYTYNFGELSLSSNSSPSYFVWNTHWEDFYTDGDYKCFDWGWFNHIEDVVEVDDGETTVGFTFYTNDSTSVYSEVYDNQEICGANDFYSKAWSFLLMVPE